MEVASRIEALSSNDHRPSLNGKIPDIFESIAVIGAAGKTGRFYTETLSAHTHIREVLRGPQNIGSMLQVEPEVVILATSNLTAKEALEDIAKNIKSPTTLILPQNGIGIVELTEEILAGLRDKVNIIRASLYTNVSERPDGGIAYDHNKKVIDFAPVGDDPDGNTERVASLFRRSGFDVGVHSDYRAMEWAKAMVNKLGSTSAITGSLEDLKNPDIFAMEHRGILDGFRILDAAGIRIDGFRYIDRLRLISRVPEWVVRDRGILGRGLREYVVGKLAAERNKQPSAAAAQIAMGVRIVEPTKYYHEPMLKLGDEVKLESPLDRALLGILIRHQRLNNGFSLTSLPPEAKIRELIEIYGLETQDLFVKKFSLFGLEPVRIALERIYEWNADTFEVLGKENLKEIVETMEMRKPVLVTPNHSSHADHVTIIKALGENLPPEGRKYPVYIVAGMKFDKEEISGRFNRAYSHPVVWTLEEEDGEEARFRAHVINRRASKVIDELLKEPCILVLYLEGSRSRTGRLHLPALGSASWLLDERFGLIAPVAITGTEKMLPPGEQKPNHANINVEFCETLKAEEFRQGTSGVSHKERDQYYGGKILRIIASRLPADRRGIYGSQAV